MENKKTTDKDVRVKKWNCFFAFYRNDGFHKLWLLVFLLSTFVFVELNSSILLVELVPLIVATVVSLIIFGAIIMFSDIPNESANINDDRTIGKMKNSKGDFPSA